MAIRLYQFDDAQARSWEPFSLTRPIGELLFGCMLLRERAERAWGVQCQGHIAAGLAGFDEPAAPPVLEGVPDWSEDRILISSRAVLAGSPLPAVDTPCTLTVGGAPVGWILPAGVAGPTAAEMDNPSAAAPDLPSVELAGTVLAQPWDLVEQNGRRIEADLTILGFGALPRPRGVRLIGNGGLFGRGGSVVEPGVIVDTRAGPVILDAKARVQGPGRITGPTYVGRGSVVLGGTVENSSIGLSCKVRGEVADSVITGYCNKAHDGYLGHALLGRWVNLGASTTNSDLKNTYGTVRVERSSGVVDTGQLKVGCFIGDHARTGIGTLINTGAVLGAGCTVFGGSLAPKFVPPFTWGTAPNASAVHLEKFLETARKAMARRDHELTEGMASLWTRAFEATRQERESRGVSD